MNGHGSDADSNPDETPDYYQPISSSGDDDSSSDSDPIDHQQNSPSNLRHLPLPLPNGYLGDNGIASLSLQDAADHKSSEEEDDDDGDAGEEQEEERAREASNSAMLKAFREDESRRNAPLRSEDAVRVMEAMRGVSFGGSAPDWAQRVPEDQWIEQLRRLRRPPRSTD
ncbi:hypothetical protein CRG98_013029 [Punica granatum]|nr:hypothetical protein CRG98_013029 [Punica granatum]